MMGKVPTHPIHKYLSCLLALGLGGILAACSSAGGPVVNSGAPGEIASRNFASGPTFEIGNASEGSDHTEGADAKRKKDDSSADSPSDESLMIRNLEIHTEKVAVNNQGESKPFLSIQGQVRCLWNHDPAKNLKQFCEDGKILRLIELNHGNELDAKIFKDKDDSAFDWSFKFLYPRPEGEVGDEWVKKGVLSFYMPRQDETVAGNFGEEPSACANLDCLKAGDWIGEMSNETHPITGSETGNQAPAAGGSQIPRVPGKK